jgi:c-di-GMP-binding flagellar brake protein YcgR
MATLIKSIEKGILLKALYDEKLPLTYYKDRSEYILTLEKPARDEMLFRVDLPIENLDIGEQIHLTFEYRGKAIAFNVKILKKNEPTDITCSIPDSFLKDLERSYSRVRVPSEMQIQFTVQGDRYDLSFPKLIEYDAEDMGGFFKNSDQTNISELIEQIATWIESFTSDHQLVLFKDTKPSITEERIISETGKSLFLPLVQEGFPPTDPFPHKRLVTEDIFKRYLESTGIGLSFINSAYNRFLKAKVEKGIFSDAWIPILFHEYVIGFIHLWIDEEGKKPFDYSMIDTLYQFTKVLAYSLEINGFFDKGKRENDTFEGNVIDISASGLLFAYPPSDISSALKPDNRLTIKIITPLRTITTSAVIIRRFKDKSLGYYGCQFDKMAIEDKKYLFEFIYGKPYTDSEFHI